MSEALKIVNDSENQEAVTKVTPQNYMKAIINETEENSDDNSFFDVPKFVYIEFEELEKYVSAELSNYQYMAEMTDAEFEAGNAKVGKMQTKMDMRATAESAFKKSIKEQGLEHTEKNTDTVFSMASRMLRIMNSPETIDGEVVYTETDKILPNQITLKHIIRRLDDFYMELPAYTIGSMKQVKSKMTNLLKERKMPKVASVAYRINFNKENTGIYKLVDYTKDKYQLIAVDTADSSEKKPLFSKKGMKLIQNDKAEY